MTAPKKKTVVAVAPPRRSFRGMAHEDRLQQRREQLLEAALEAFGTRGYHGTTVREICNGAKLTERYFYESFKSLEALFSALYRGLNDQLRSATLLALAQTQKMAPGKIDAFAEAALRVLLTFIQNDPRRARVMFIDAIGISLDVQQISGEITREYAELMRSFIDHLFPGARERGVDIDIIAAGMLGTNIHIATWWVREGMKAPLDAVLRNNMTIYKALIAYWPRIGSASTDSDGDRVSSSTSPGAKPPRRR